MTRFPVAACTTAVLAAAAATAGPPHHAVAIDDLSWSYYGVTNGPYIAYPPSFTKPHAVLPDGRTKHARPILVYGPVPEVERIDYKHHSGFPAHGFGLGWIGTRTPSPRPNPLSVSVYPTSPAPAPACVRVAVKLPTADAKVWFGDEATTATGTDRTFDSPPLTAGREYRYVVTAAWVEGGVERREERQVAGKPGEVVAADFTR